MKDGIGTIVTVLSAIIGVAILAVIVSQKSNTANVITAAGSAFSGILSAAVSPVSGQAGLGNLSTQFNGNFGTASQPFGIINPSTW